MSTLGGLSGSEESPIFSSDRKSEKELSKAGKLAKQVIHMENSREGLSSTEHSYTDETRDGESPEEKEIRVAYEQLRLKKSAQLEDKGTKLSPEYVQTDTRDQSLDSSRYSRSEQIKSQKAKIETLKNTPPVNKTPVKKLEIKRRGRLNKAPTSEEISQLKGKIEEQVVSDPTTFRRVERKKMENLNSQLKWFNEKNKKEV
jgi:hypothetical protein